MVAYIVYERMFFTKTHECYIHNSATRNQLANGNAPVRLLFVVLSNSFSIKARLLHCCQRRDHDRPTPPIPMNVQPPQADKPETTGH